MSSDPGRWEVSPEFPEGRFVPLTPEEIAERAQRRIQGEADAFREATEAGNKRTIEESLQDRLTLLRTSLDAVTANPPTLFASVSAAERRLLRDLLRQSIELTRLARQLLEATN